MNSVIKPEYQDTWFAVPKVLIEGYMPTLGINALSIYIILSCYQDAEGKINKPISKICKVSGMGGMRIVHTLDYLKRLKLVNDFVTENNIRGMELAFKPQPVKKIKK